MIVEMIFETLSVQDLTTFSHYLSIKRTYFSYTCGSNVPRNFQYC